jgi:hypothetical protein
MIGVTDGASVIGGSKHDDLRSIAQLRIRQARQLENEPGVAPDEQRCKYPSRISGEQRSGHDLVDSG